MIYLTIFQNEDCGIEKKKEKKIHLNCTDDIADILMSNEKGDYCYTTKVYNCIMLLSI